MTMKISTKGRYGLRVMIDLATYSVDKHIPLREISKRQNITIKYLEQIMTPLLRAGYVTSFRGNNGGYQLACAPADVSVGEIIRTMEGSLAPVACLEGEENTCPNARTSNQRRHASAGISQFPGSAESRRARSSPGRSGGEIRIG